MIVVGLTGGIGSGKTIVCKVFEKLNIPIYSADIEAKKLMNSNFEIKSKLISEFGKNVYRNNSLNKKFLANIIFNNKKKLHFVNSVVHPIVKKHIKNWVSLQTSNYVIIENAILFESGFDKIANKIITVTAPEELKIQRVIKRDDSTYEEVKSRINNQMPDEYKIKKSDFVIKNDNEQLILPQILKIHKEIF